MEISLIAAVSKNLVIGREGSIPWFDNDEIRKPDMKRFRELTKGNIVIMGRKTFYSIGEPLKDRTNIVLARKPTSSVNGVRFIRNIGEAIGTAQDIANGKKEIYVIGGSEIYSGMIHHADIMYLTEIHAEYQGDAFFPEYKHSGQWTEISRERAALFDFTTYVRKTKI